MVTCLTSWQNKLKIHMKIKSSTSDGLLPIRIPAFGCVAMYANSTIKVKLINKHRIFVMFGNKRLPKTEPLFVLDV